MRSLKRLFHSRDRPVVECICSGRGMYSSTEDEPHPRKNNRKDVKSMIREEVIRNGSGRTVCHLDAKSRTIEIVKCGWKTTIQFPENGDPIITDTMLNAHEDRLRRRDNFNCHVLA